MGTWTPKLKLTSDTPFSTDEGYIVEGDVVRLSDDVSVVAGLSSDSYALRLWGCRRSGGSTTVAGPFVFNNGFGYPAEYDDDPVAAWAIVDLAFLKVTGAYTFSMHGKPEETFNGSDELDPLGDFLHLLSHFEVNPDTLVITRTGFTTENPVTHSAHQNTSAYFDSPSSGPSVVMLSVGEQTWAIKFLDYGVASSTFASSDVGSTIEIEPHAVATSGPYIVFLAHTDNDTGYGFVKAEGDAGMTIVDYTAPYFSSDVGEYTTFSCTLPDGRVAFSVGELFDAGDDSYSVRLVIVDPTTMTVDVDSVIDTEASGAGWTGGWYANVRSIDCWPDGRIVMGWVSGGEVFTYAIVSPTDGSVTETGPVSDFHPAAYSDNYAWYARIACDPVTSGKATAIYSRRVTGDESEFGVWVSFYGEGGRMRILVNPDGATLDDRWKFA